MVSTKTPITKALLPPSRKDPFRNDPFSGPDARKSGTFKRGVTERGYSHLLASALSLRAVGPATVLSQKCDMLPVLKDDQIVRDNRLPVHCRHLVSRRHRIVILVATQMSLPPVCLPLFKCAQENFGLISRSLDMALTCRKSSQFVPLVV